MPDLTQISGFMRDAGNLQKNWSKHGVEKTECEEVFLNIPLLLGDDDRHSRDERRFFALGKTDLGRELFLVFTLRQAQIRVISARPMSRKERTIYAEADTRIRE